MKKSPENNNLLQTLLKMYPLDKASKWRLKHDFFNPPMVQPLNEFFKSSDDLRVYLTSEQLPSADKSYEKLLKTFKKAVDVISSTDWMKGMVNGVKVKKVIQDLYVHPDLNKSQASKFFNDYLLDEYEKVLALKTNGKDETKIMISKNPLDFWFCSASKSFDSCLDTTKNNQYTQAYGLINAIPDPSRFIVAQVKGWRFLMYAGKLYKIPNIINRSWASMDSEGRIALIRWFGGDPVDSKALGQAMTNNKNPLKSTEPFEPYCLFYGSNQRKAIPFYYVDKGSAQLTSDYKKMYFDLTRSGGSGGIMNQYGKELDGSINRIGFMTFFHPLKHDTRTETGNIMNMGDATEQVFCHKCQNWFYPTEGHKCSEKEKVNLQDTFFGMTFEKTYKVQTARSETVLFPKSKLVEFMKNKDVIIKDKRLILKGVA